MSDVYYHPENNGHICVIRDVNGRLESLRVLDWCYQSWAGCFTQLAEVTQ